MLQITKSDIKTQIAINLEYADKIDDGIMREAAIHLVLLLATQLTQEERQQLATTHTLARNLVF